MALFLYEWRKSISVPGLLLMMMLVTMKLVIFYGYCQNYPQEYQRDYQQYLNLVANMDTSEAIWTLQRENSESLDKLQEQARVACLEQLQKIQYREYIQTAAQEGSTVTFNMPLDYLSLMDHYATLPLPQQMNTVGWNLFFQLNIWNLLPCVVLFLFSPMVAMEREGKLYGVLRSTPAGIVRLLKVKWSVVVIFSLTAFHLLLAEDLVLCWCVFPLRNLDLPFSSVFPQVVSALSLSNFLFRYYTGNVLYLLCLSTLLLPVSSCFSSGKAAVCVFLLVYGALILANSVFPPSSLLKLAVGDLAGLYKRTLLFPLGENTWQIDLMGFGCYLLVGVLCGVVSWQLFRRKRIKKEGKM